MQLLFTVLAPTMYKQNFFLAHKKFRHVPAKHVVTRLAETCSSLLRI